MPSGNKPLPEPMSTQIYITIWPSLVHNKLSFGSGTLWHIQGLLIPSYIVTHLPYLWRYHQCSPWVIQSHTLMLAAHPAIIIFYMASPIFRKFTVQLGTHISCKTHLELKSGKTLFDHNFFWSCPIIWKFCTEHGSDTSIFCTQNQNDKATKSDVMVDQDLARY